MSLFCCVFFVAGGGGRSKENFFLRKNICSDKNNGFPCDSIVLFLFFAFFLFLFFQAFYVATLK